MPKLTVSINGAAPVSGTMDALGTIDGQRSWQIMLGGPVFEFDSFEHMDGEFVSLTVDNSRNDASLKACTYRGDIDGENFEFVRSPGQPIMTRLRFTWGPRPDRQPQTFFEFAPLPKQPAWSESEWKFPLGMHGPLTTPMTNTGSGEDRSCDVPNWYGSDDMTRAYADAEGLWPVAVREPLSPFAAIGRAGFQMGYNAFDHLAFKAGQTGIGMKFQLPHAVNASVLGYELFRDLFYRRSVTNLARYAAMYNRGNWGDFTGKSGVLAFSETRGLGRGLCLMLHGHRAGCGLFVLEKIQDVLRAMDNLAGDPMSLPFLTQIDPSNGKKFVQYWQMSFIFYALDLAIRTGVIQKSAYLEAAMDFQEKLTARGQTIVPYRAWLKDPTKPSDLANWEPLPAGVGRESDAFVIGEIMRRHGRKPPAPLEQLMRDQGEYPIRNNAAHFIYDSTRPKRTTYRVEVAQKAAGVYDKPSFAGAEALRILGANLALHDYAQGPFEQTVRIAAE